MGQFKEVLIWILGGVLCTAAVLGVLRVIVPHNRNTTIWANSIHASIEIPKSWKSEEPPRGDRISVTRKYSQGVTEASVLVNLMVFENDKALKDCAEQLTANYKIVFHREDHVECEKIKLGDVEAYKITYYWNTLRTDEYLFIAANRGYQILTRASQDEFENCTKDFDSILKSFKPTN